MKTFVLILFTFISINAQSQASAYFIASQNGIGPFKIGMSKSEIETILKSKITDSVNLTPRDTIDPHTFDTLVASPVFGSKILYKGIQFGLEFMKPKWIKNSQFELVAITTLSNKVKTVEGITIATSENELKKLASLHNTRLLQIPYLGEDSYVLAGKGETGSKVLWVHLQNSVVMSIGVANMIGD